MSLRTSKSLVTKEAVNKRVRLVHTSPSASEMRELIATRAYELYKLRGAEFGDELSDWLAAEGEVVTMLLAEPLETSETEKPKGRSANRKANSPPTAKAANGARQRVARRPKRDVTMNGNPA